MKKVFEIPEMEIVEFESEDVLTTSTITVGDTQSSTDSTTQFSSIESIFSNL